MYCLSVYLIEIQSYRAFSNMAVDHWCLSLIPLISLELLTSISSANTIISLLFRWDEKELTFSNIIRNEGSRHRRIPYPIRNISKEIIPKKWYRLIIYNISSHGVFKNHIFQIIITLIEYGLDISPEFCWILPSSTQYIFLCIIRFSLFYLGIYLSPKLTNISQNCGVLIKPRFTKHFLSLIKEYISIVIHFFLPRREWTLFIGHMTDKNIKNSIKNNFPLDLRVNFQIKFRPICFINYS